MVIQSRKKDFLLLPQSDHVRGRCKDEQQLFKRVEDGQLINEHKATQQSADFDYNVDGQPSNVISFIDNVQSNSFIVCDSGNSSSNSQQSVVLDLDKCSPMDVQNQQPAVLDEEGWIMLQKQENVTVIAPADNVTTQYRGELPEEITQARKNECGGLSNSVQKTQERNSWADEVEEQIILNDITLGEQISEAKNDHQINKVKEILLLNEVDYDLGPNFQDVGKILDFKFCSTKSLGDEADSEGEEIFYQILQDRGKHFGK